MTFRELAEGSLYINKLAEIKDYLHGYRCNEIILGAEGSGKTSFLSLINMIYSDENVNLPGWDELKSKISENAPVIRVSFADMKPGSYDEIVSQVAEMLKKLYLQFTDIILGDEDYDYRDAERFLDIIEGCCEDISDGLDNLVYMLYWRRNNDACRPVVLVDEPFLPLYVSNDDETDRIKEFFREFFRFTESNLTSRMLFVSSYPVDGYCIPYGYECFPNDIYHGRISTLFFLNKHGILEYLQKNNVKYDSEELEKLLSEEKERFIKSDYIFNKHDYDGYFGNKQKTEFTEDDYIYSLGFASRLAGAEPQKCRIAVPENIPSDPGSIIKKHRTKIEKLKEEERIRNERHAEEKRKRYAESFSSDIGFPSRFIGVRVLPELRETDRLKVLTEKVKELYRIYSGNRTDDESLYRFMQGVDSDVKTDWDLSEDKLEDYCISAYSLNKHQISISEDHTWCQVNFVKDNDDRMALSSMIKVYASVSDTRVKDIFLGAVHELMSNGEKQFYSKVSLYKRNDSMCFWVSRRGFFLLEKYYSDKELVRPLFLTPYRGNLAVSREMFSGWHSSYNSCVIDMMKLYFERIQSENDISIYDMYQLVTDMWNGKFGTEERKPYVDDNAHLLVVLLESLDVISGNAEISDDSFLLSEDELWGTLCSCHCWAELPNKRTEQF